MQDCRECVVTHYDESTPEADYFTQHFAGSDVPDEVHSTVELLLRYLHGTVMADLSHINRLVRIERNSFMNLDVTAIRNLELVRNMTGRLEARYAAAGTGFYQYLDGCAPSA